MSCIRKYCWVLLLLAGHWSRAQSPAAPSKNDSIFNASSLSSFRLFDAGRHRNLALPRAATMKLFVFLSPECPICQGYTVKLNEFQQRYSGRIKIYGIIPGNSYKPAAVSAFAEKYKIGYPLLIDGSLGLSHYLQASVTPEVILLGPGNELVYKGAIDNWYKALGKSRIRTTENYLQDAIDHALRQELPTIKRTTPVGCLLNDF
jgi:thiol-disulfide isomerase/thioredoxin